MQAYGMFTFDEETRTYWFSQASIEAGTEFRLVGQLMGLAIFNSIILDAHFPHCLYLKLLGKKPGFPVGRCHIQKFHTLPCSLSMGDLLRTVLNEVGRAGSGQSKCHSLFVAFVGLRW